MKETTNPNFIRASNLILISAALGLINFLFFTPSKSTYEISIGIVAVALVVAIAFVVRKAYQWIKWVLLILTVLGVLATILTLPAIIHQDLVVSIVSLLQALLQTTALILMFLPNKSLAKNITELPENN